MDLSKRQTQVVELALKGLSNRQIAGSLSISPSTVSTHKDRAFTRQGVKALTERERQVAELTAKGLTSRQMGELLGVSERTVELHRWHIFKKLGITRAAHLASILNEEVVNGLRARIAELEDQVARCEAERAQHR